MSQPTHSSELFNAITSNDVFYLQKLLMDCPNLDLDQPLIGGLTALHVAAEKGYSSCVKALVAAGANVNSEDDSGYTPLMNAVTAGYPLVMSALLKSRQCDCNHMALNSGTALHLACHLDSLVAAQLLLNAGTSPHLLDNHGDNALSIALARPGFFGSEIVQALLLGCRYMDPNTAGSPAFVNAKLLSKLKARRFLVLKSMLFSGYCSVRLKTSPVMQQVKDDMENMTNTQRECVLFIMDYMLHPPTLQHLVRLTLRKSLNFNIWDKAKRLELPVKLQDWICFKDFYDPPILNTEYEVYSMFSEHPDLC